MTAAAASEAEASVAKLRELAIQARARGALTDAERLLRQALGAAPGNFAVLRELADLFVQGGRPDAARPIYDRLIQARPGAVNVIHNRGVALMALKRPADAVADFEAAIALRPDFVSALFNRALALGQLGRAAESEASYVAVIKLKPDHVQALGNRGVTLVGLGRPAEALACMDRALELAPEDAGVLGNRAHVLSLLGRPAEALDSAERALRIKPDDVVALLNRGNACRELGRFEDAVTSLNRALVFRPDYPEALNNLGNALTEMHRFTEALESYDRVLELAPNFPEAINNRGNALRQLGRPGEALACFDRAIQLRPGYVDAWENRGVALAELGQVEAAAEAIDQAIVLAPRRVRLHQIIVELRKTKPGDPSLAVLEDIARRPAALGAHERIQLRYALGKAYADIGEHDRSFRNYAKGASLKRAEVAYGEAGSLDDFERIAKAFTKPVVRRRRGKGEPSQAPVFILGMPRSGTTLIEQILSRHPKVFAAGETPAFAEAVEASAVLGGQALGRMEAFAGASAETLRELGADYIARLAAMAPGAERVTNKTTINFAVAGLIHMALPNARIIHARRDAADTCWSCFTKLFVQDLPHTYDLGELGRYYRAYEALMDHWRQVLPEGVMLEVRYEDVVADLETQARAIVAHCGLEWDPACLDFQEGGRQVRTASTLQVRRPIYSSSVGRWKAYEAHLKPLIEALGPR